MLKVKDNLRTLLFCVVITFGCLFGYLLLQNLSVELFVRLGWEARADSDLFANGFWLTFFVVGLIVPVCEELIFRFVICRLLKLTKMPEWWIIVLSAFVFMIYHTSWSQTIYQFLMGFWFAWIFLKTNKIGWTVLMHIINNVFILAYTSLVGNEVSVFALTPWNITLSLGLAIITTIIVSLLIKKGIPKYEK